MYVLNHNIRIGDIILLDSNSLPATVIKLQANGDYSHAAIVISESQAIEAMGGSGVQISSLLRFQVDDISNLAVYRANDIEQDKFTQLIHKAIKHQAKSYDLAGALKSTFSFSQTEESKFFCSELVAHLYNEMGIQLFNKESAQVKPNDFTRCDKLTDVSNEVVSELSSHIKQRFEKRPHLWKPLDRKNSSISPDALRHQKFLADAQKVFKERKLDIPKNMHDILEIMTRPCEDGHVYLDENLDNALVHLYEKHKILESKEDEIKQSFVIASDFKNEIDDLEIEPALEEYVLYESLLSKYNDDLEDKLIEAQMINDVSKLYPSKYVQARVKYTDLIVSELIPGLMENLKSRIGALQEHIVKLHEH